MSLSYIDRPIWVQSTTTSKLKREEELKQTKGVKTAYTRDHIYSVIQFNHMAVMMIDRLYSFI